MLCLTLDIWHRHLTCYTWHLISDTDTGYVILNTWYLTPVLDMLYLTLNIWHLHLTCYTWHLISDTGTWHVILDTWYMTPILDMLSLDTWYLTADIWHLTVDMLSLTWHMLSPGTITLNLILRHLTGYYYTWHLYYMAYSLLSLLRESWHDYYTASDIWCSCTPELLYSWTLISLVFMSPTPLLLLIEQSDRHPAEHA